MILGIIPIDRIKLTEETNRVQDRKKYNETDIHITQQEARDATADSDAW